MAGPASTDPTPEPSPSATAPASENALAGYPVGQFPAVPLFSLPDISRVSTAGKKLRDKLDHMKPKFIEGGKKNGHDPKILEKIWADWEKFASYAFNKSHATCYSWVAYQTAYLKANYPSEYMAATMSRNISNITEITKLMEECQSMGIKTLGPDVNESYRVFGVNEHGEIRFGLSAIKGMGAPAAAALVAERLKNGPYKSIFDFL